MRYLRVVLSCAALVFGLLWSAAAQDTTSLETEQTRSAAPAPSIPTPAAAAAMHIDDAFIHKQFGDEFSLVAMSAPFTRDLDGDGVEDLAIAALSKKPMLDAGEHSYRVIDPYYAFYGYGDPKMTTTFGSEDLQTKHLVILVIHGMPYSRSFLRSVARWMPSIAAARLWLPSQWLSTSANSGISSSRSAIWYSSVVSQPSRSRR